MVSRSLKALYYKLFWLPMKMHGVLYKAFRAPRGGVVKVHLGPGQKKYIEGWINLDANFISARKDVWVDLRNPLPFHDNTVDIFYSHHMIEHLPDSFLPFHFNEMFRCLKPGGIIRIAGPNGDSAMKKFMEGDLGWFGEWPDKRRSIGGRLVNFLLCRGEHLTILTYSYLEELAADAGFIKITQCQPAESKHTAIIEERVLAMENEPNPEVPHTLVIEAEKLTRR